MNGKKKRILQWTVCGIVLFFLMFCNGQTGMAKDDNTLHPQNAIVKLYTGYVGNSDTTGTFRSAKECSGCLVSNVEGSVYLVAPYHAMILEEQESNDFLKANHLKKEDVTLARKVVISGDMRADVEVVTSSRENDFCLLSVENVIQEKEPVRFATSGKLKKDAIVHAFGFPAQTQQGARFDQNDVAGTQGNVIAIGDYIQHTATIDAGMIGGALVDQNGYFVGMNNLVSGQEGSFYSLNGSLIQNLLDNRGIIYESESKDKAVRSLNKELKKCSKILSSSKYKASSLENLSTAVEEVNRTLESTANLSEHQAKQLEQQLETARSQLKKKTPVLFVVMIVAGIVDGILLFCVLLSFCKLHKKKKELKQIQSPVSQQPIPPMQSNIPVSQQLIPPMQSNIPVSQPPVPPMQSQQSVPFGVTNESEKQQPIPVQDNMNRNRMQNANGMSELQKSVQKSIIPENNTAYAVKKKAFLHRIKDDEFILIAKTPFLIGKQAEAVNYCIMHNKSVSRVHASIQKHNGSYILYDMNSVNGTYLNGERLKTDPKMIKHGDRIQIANEAFEFIIQG
ncbi:FHA domain-containing protein [Jutongia hominis]|uniref:FHA domain-containing protein n=1 Tax=Jutongia hominis TaxID=2763664 RepID=A0ABR7MUK8_9FIRM|nr:FHA domain-containing protein [Jutongia hominis]MBC8557475.1 FHA domain-containing protein [Jutongia hominis]